MGLKAVRMVALVTIIAQQKLVLIGITVTYLANNLHNRFVPGYRVIQLVD